MPMTPRKHTAQIRRLLSAPDFDTVRQGVALLRAAEPEVIAPLTAGSGLELDEAVVSPEVKRRVRSAYRGWVALALARVGGHLDGAERLTVALPPELVDLSPLEGLTTLRALLLRAPLAVTDIDIDLSILAGLTGLRSLHLSWYTGMTDLRPLAGLTGLTSLRTYACTRLTDLSPLAGLHRLERLQLNGCYHLTDLRPLGGLVELEQLDLTHSHRLTDLGPLAGLRRLRKLELSMCERLTDLSPLAGLEALCHLTVSHSPGFGHLPRQTFSTREEVVRLLRG